MKKIIPAICVLILLAGWPISASAASPLVKNTWVHTVTGMDDILPDYPTGWSIVFTPDYSSAGQGKVFAGVSTHGAYNGIFKSADSGLTWNGTSYHNAAYSLAISPNYANDHLMAVGTESQGVGITTAEWSPGTNITYSLPDVEILAVAFSPNYAIDHQLFAGTRNHGLYMTVDLGVNWIYAGPKAALPDSTRIQCIVFTPDYATSHTLYIAASLEGTLSGVYRGVWSQPASQITWIWTQLTSGLTNMNLRTLAISPNYAQDHTLYQATYSGGLFKSSNSGSSWAHITGTENLYVQALAISPDYARDGEVYFGEDGNGVYRYLDGAASPSVSQMNAGFPNLVDGGAITSLAFAPGKPRILFAGQWESAEGGIWQYLFSINQYLPLVRK